MAVLHNPTIGADAFRRSVAEAIREQADLAAARDSQGGKGERQGAPPPGGLRRVPGLRRSAPGRPRGGPRPGQATPRPPRGEGSGRAACAPYTPIGTRV